MDAELMRWVLGCAAGFLKSFFVRSRGPGSAEPQPLLPEKAQPLVGDAFQRPRKRDAPRARPTAALNPTRAIITPEVGLGSREVRHSQMDGVPFQGLSGSDGNVTEEEEFSERTAVVGEIGAGRRTTAASAQPVELVIVKRHPRQ